MFRTSPSLTALTPCLPLPMHPSVSLPLSVVAILEVTFFHLIHPKPPLDPPPLDTLTRARILPQIASHLYSVVLHTTTRTDGSHSWLLNYAQTFLDSESGRE